MSSTSKKKTKITDWAAIRTDYECNGYSINSLSKKYNKDRATITKRVKGDNWTRKTAEIQQEVSKKTAEAIIDQKVAANEKHIKLTDDSMEIIQMLLQKYKEELASGSKKPKATAMSIDYILSAIVKAQKIQRLAMNIDDSGVNDEPEINIIKGLDITKI